MKKLVSIALALVLILSLGSGFAAKLPWPSGTPIIEYFENLDSYSKPMARMWFPDASAGADDNDVVEKQILALAEAGFGGVEFTMLSDTGEYNNEQARIYGWGTENYKKLLKKLFNAAAKVPGGFQIDVTMTAHWPLVLNNLDPNDEAASKETSYSFTKITADALTSGKLDLALPAQKTADSQSKRFIFTDDFVAAAVARVTGGSGNNLQLDFTSLEVITSGVAPKETEPGVFAGSAAGVPDAATAAANGWDYATICENFGPEPSLPLTVNNGKQDANFDRARMADWQYIYQADLSDLTLTGLNNNAAIAVGDYVVLTTYMRGTGQVMSGGRGKLMHNMTYVTNYFNEIGTKIVTDYWDEYILDPELISMMRSDNGYMFEDSIECNKTGSAYYWAETFMDRVDPSYAYADILPSIVASNNVTWSNDNGLVARLKEDYNLVGVDNYLTFRDTGVSEWARNTLNRGFRNQPHSLPGLDVGASSMFIDCPEGDNGCKGDGLRYLRSAMNIDGKPYITMEAVTGSPENQMTLADALTECTQNFSHGVNRQILHGTGYSKSVNGFGADWPGWMPFGSMQNMQFGNCYTYRQIYFDDFSTELDFMARTQAVLQKGTAKVDFAVLMDASASFNMGSGNRYQDALNAGYSYNRMSAATLTHPNCVITDKMLAANGPAYKALVVDRLTVASLETMQKLLAYADAGLPIILEACNPAKVYGSKSGDDALVQAAYAQLLAKPGVVAVSNPAGVLSALRQLGVESYASYSVSQLETSMYKDPVDGTNYYFMFNNPRPTNSGMLSAGQGESYKGEARAINKAEITLKGSGVPYILDAMKGTVTQIGEYTDNGDGTITFVLDKLYGGESTIVAVTTNLAAFPQASAVVAGVDKPAANYAIVRDGANLSLRSNVPGDYGITFTDGFTAEASVSKSLSVLNLSGADWSLVIDSYSPKFPQASTLIDPVTRIQTVDPSDHKVTRVDFGTQKLGNWSAIAASSQQLAALGVTNMRNVSGIGYYTITFDAPADWDANTGAYLDVTYGRDQVGSYTVNGALISKANNATDRIDLAGLLVPGQNTITIKLNTTLYGRAYIEHHLYTNLTTGAPMAWAAAYTNGLKSVTLTPYTQVSISNSVEASIRADESSVIVNTPASYTVSLANAKGVGVVELSFEFDGEVLDKDSITATPLNGFSSGIFSGLTFQYIGSGFWKGTVKYMCPGYVSADSPLDVVKISGTALVTGPATVTLTGVEVSGDNVTSLGIIPSQIVAAEATVFVGGKPAKYSKYDLNKDGVIDETDLLYLIYFYQWNDRDAGWATDDLYGVCAKDCDFQVNGKVDLADMIELTANYGPYDPYDW